MRLRTLTHACAAGVLVLTTGACTTTDQSTAEAPVTGLRPVAEAAAAGPTRYVLAISVDGLNPRALARLGAAQLPNFQRFIRYGAVTMHARTERERTTTLPNHTGMLTGRRVDRDLGGHGVWFNRDSGRTVHHAAGHGTASVFDVVRAHGRSTALFTSKKKFALFHRSWGPVIDRYTVIEHDAHLVDAVQADLARNPRALTFLHLSLPDRIGHARGFGSTTYLKAVRATDARLGELFATIRSQDRLRDHLTVILTSDHGGRGGGHSDPTSFENFRVPFMAWGAGVARRADLYQLNPEFRHPGRRRTSYSSTRQPIRNGAMANLATDLLGYGRVRHSEHNAAQTLDLR